MSLDVLLQELETRLPELEWKVSTLGSTFSPKAFPKGLFRSGETSPTNCIAEIKSDIKKLALSKGDKSPFYLAQRIQQKINVLVSLCQLQTSKPKPEAKIHFGVNSISTRQQWLQSLEQEINLLMIQREAMLKTFAQMKTQSKTEALLHLQAELGEVERRLTLAKETFARA
mgnify:CR=1 FL=1